jgi:hypothetical protein
MAPGSQGGAIAQLGIQPATFSTPLLDQAAQQPQMGTGSLSPFPWAETANWGWGGGSSLGSFGGGGMGGGFDFDFGGSSPMMGGSWGSTYGG